MVGIKLGGLWHINVKIRKVSLFPLTCSCCGIKNIVPNAHYHKDLPALVGFSCWAQGQAYGSIQTLVGEVHLDVILPAPVQDKKNGQMSAFISTKRKTTDRHNQS